jgi:hypothetical protein
MTRALAAVVTAALASAACDGGGGPSVSDATQREQPGQTRDTPPATRDDPSGACLQCDVQYTCTDATGQGQTIRVQLSTQSGTCTDATIALFCSGVLFGATGCAIVGGGMFTCGSYTCTPPGG